VGKFAQITAMVNMDFMDIVIVAAALYRVFDYEGKQVCDLLRVADFGKTELFPLA
jgi:hypothetical protein